jgi:hypothetical protein
MGYRQFVTIRFQSKPGNTAGGVFGVAILRSGTSY